MNSLPFPHPSSIRDGLPGEPRLNLDRVRVDPMWALKLPATVAQRRKVLPIAIIEGVVQIACADTGDITTLRNIERYIRVPMSPRAADIESLDRALKKVYGESDPNRGRVELVTAPGSGSLPEEILSAAVLREASDVHVNPTPDVFLVRFRVDGRLETYQEVPREQSAGLVNQLKVMAGMDIAEKRAPQDGGFRFTSPATRREVDIRAASLPTKYGERLTLRLLALQTGDLTLGRLGMAQRHKQLFEDALDADHGLILITGPTGSGKSTTLYAGIRHLIGRHSLNVITVEDPVEYEIAGVIQTQVDSVDKVSFSRALRSILRHDPDVVMIGEIRDQETAEIAIKASLTGHLVMSTLHTNSAAGAVTRLADMGIERFLIGSTVRLTVGQRLVRRGCPHCGVPTPLTAEQATWLGDMALEGQNYQVPAGCIYCAARGYSGRLGIFEMLPVDERVSSQLVKGCEEFDLIQQMQARGLPRLIDDARQKLLAGMTTFDEVRNAVSAW